MAVQESLRAMYAEHVLRRISGVCGKAKVRSENVGREEKEEDETEEAREEKEERKRKRKRKRKVSWKGEEDEGSGNER
ncbi:hypothetical protein RF55_17912 [Lasius niger]|uniref:Uncharacterized protein n=1 Tax=Lasius niger TaxID=67767 RepID=A0A0J7MV27_LASNI|nr:hypothetical protein RF55_17912 [Lasius niger]